MSILTFLYIALLFFALVPGVLLSLPQKGSKTVVAGVHAVVFALVFSFTQGLIQKLSIIIEGNTTNNKSMWDMTTEEREQHEAQLAKTRGQQDRIKDIKRRQAQEAELKRKAQEQQQALDSLYNHMQTKKKTTK